MKILSGQELALFIKERQAHYVRSLLRTSGIVPCLAIVYTTDNPVIDLYVHLKRRYAKDIGIKVDLYKISQREVPKLLAKLNQDEDVDGIIIQLPLEDPTETDKLVNLVDPDKDVDALGEKSQFEPATPMAILWLLAGYNIDLTGKKVVLLGKGRLVGKPLMKILHDSGIDVTAVDRSTDKLEELVSSADVVIAATGQPSILKSEMVKPRAVVVDAGVASENGKTVGDVDQSVFDREDLVITPKKGGVGPLTICALFDNVIRSAQRRAG